MLSVEKTRIDLRKEFQEKGYLICRNFFSQEEMVQLLEHIKSAKTRNGVSGLNKGSLTFYSSLFFYTPKIQQFISQPKIANFLKEIIGPNFWVRWDQAVAKGNGSGIFPWHQDNAYSDLKDEYYQLWIAITEMTPDNGGLCLVPGSHRSLLPHKRVDNHLEYDGIPNDPVFIEARPGDVVLFSSLMLHKTPPNITSNTRWAYVVEYMSSDHFDPSIEPPYFMVAHKGQSKPRFCNFYRGNLNPLNRLKYLRFRRKPLVNSLLDRLSKISFF